MGREIRRVPADWQHPTEERGGRVSYVPLYDKQYDESLEAWYEGRKQWLAGTHPDQQSEHFKQYPSSYEEWHGSAPDPYQWRQRKWTQEEATAYQVYETVSEGTPISPVFTSLEDLIAWLIEQGYSEGAARAFAQEGWVPSMVMTRHSDGSTEIFKDIESADK